MGRKESARAIRDDFKFSDFIGESALGLGAEAVERRKLMAFDYPEEAPPRGRTKVLGAPSPQFASTTTPGRTLFS